MDVTSPAAKPGDASARAAGASSRPAALAALDALRERALAFWEVWPLLAIALASTLFYFRSAPVTGLPFDDSYISLQFARNLAGHAFLTFDGDTASAGATSVLHVMLLAVPIKLGVDPVKASLALGVVSQLGLVATVYWLSWTIFRDRIAASLAALSVSVVGYLVLDSLNGMETTLFMLVTTAAAAAYLGAKDDRGRLVAGLLAALAVLTRPEGVLLLGAIGIYELVARSEEPLVSAATVRRLALLAAPSVLVLILLSAYYWFTTDSFTPGTATAKLLFFREFELPLVEKSRLLQSGLGAFVAPLWPWLVLAALAARRRETLLFAVFWLAFIVIYYWFFPGGIEHYWYRYQHVFLPPLIVYGAAGAVSIVRGKTLRLPEIAAGAAIGLVLVAFVALQYESFRSSYVGEIRLNEERQVAAALTLKEIVPPGESIATHDIGAISYFSGRNVVDLVGLVNPDVVDYHEGRRMREYTDRVRPAYIAVFEVWEDDYLQIGLDADPELFELITPPKGTGRFKVYKTHYDD